MRRCLQPSVRGSRGAAAAVRRCHGHAAARRAPEKGLSTARSGVVDCSTGHESGSGCGCGGVEWRYLPATLRCHRSCETLSPRLWNISLFCASASLAAGTEQISSSLPHKISGRPPGTPRFIRRPLPRPPTMGDRPAAASPVMAGVPSGGRRRCRPRPVNEWRHAAGR